MDISSFRTHRTSLDSDSKTSQSCKDILDKALKAAESEELDIIQLRHLLIALEGSSGNALHLMTESLRNSRLSEEGLTLRDYLRKYYKQGKKNGQSEYFIHQILENAKTGKDLVDNFFKLISNPRYKTSPENHPIAYLFRYTDEVPNVVDPNVGYKPVVVYRPRTQPFRGWFYEEVKQGLLTNAE